MDCAPYVTNMFLVLKTVPLSSFKQFNSLSSNSLLIFEPSVPIYIKYNESQFNLEPKTLKCSTNWLWSQWPMNKDPT